MFYVYLLHGLKSMIFFTQYKHDGSDKLHYSKAMLFAIRSKL